MTPGIRVPEQYRDSRTIVDTAGIVKCIRDIIQANPGRLLKIEDFIEITGTNTAKIVVADLRRRGKIERIKIKTGKKGHAYTYRWHDVAPVISEGLFEPGVMKAIDEYSRHFINELAGTGQSAQIDGVVQFVKYLHSQNS